MLLETLTLQNPSFVSDVSLDDVIHALENAVTYISVRRSFSEFFVTHLLLSSP